MFFQVGHALFCYKLFVIKEFRPRFGVSDLALGAILPSCLAVAGCRQDARVTWFLLWHLYPLAEVLGAGVEEIDV